MSRIEQVIEDYEKAKLHCRINLILTAVTGLCFAVCLIFLAVGEDISIDTLFIRAFMALLTLIGFILQSFDYQFSRKVLKEEEFRLSREMDIHNAIH